MRFQIVQARPVLDQPRGDIGFDHHLGAGHLFRGGAQKALFGKADAEDDQHQRGWQPPAMPRDDERYEKRGRHHQRRDGQMRQVRDHGERGKAHGQQKLPPAHPAPEDRQRGDAKQKHRREGVGHQIGHEEGQRAQRGDDHRQADHLRQRDMQPHLALRDPHRQPDRQHHRQGVQKVQPFKQAKPRQQAGQKRIGRRTRPIDGVLGVDLGQVGPGRGGLAAIHPCFLLRPGLGIFRLDRGFALEPQLPQAVMTLRDIADRVEIEQRAAIDDHDAEHRDEGRDDPERVANRAAAPGLGLHRRDGHASTRPAASSSSRKALK